GGLDGGVATRAHFAPEADPMPWGAAPWPDDLFLDEDGRVALGVYPNESNVAVAEYPEALRASLGELDGFGVVAPVYFPIDGAIDPASLPADGASSLREDASAFLVDADPASPTAFERVPVQGRWLPERQLVALRPADGYPLNEGGTYAAVLTTRVRDAAGAPLGPAASFARIRDGETRPEDPLLGEAFDRYAPVLASLATEGVPREEVAALAVFRVQTVTAELARVREQLWATAAPTPTIDEVLAGDALDARLGAPEGDRPGLGVPGGVAHGSIGWMVQGSFEAPWYLGAQPNVHGPFVREGEEIVAPRVEEVPFTLLLPVAGVDAPLRLVVFQHGITAERSDALGIADALCQAGYAVVAIDAPFHGLRNGAATDDANVFTGAEEPDGFGDRRGPEIIIDYAGLMDFLGPLIDFHPVYFRDANRQAAADLLALVRVMLGGDWSALGEAAPALEGVAFEESIGFVGNSLGGILGAKFVAVEESVGAAVLAVTGGGLVHAVAESPAFNPTYLPQLYPLLGLDPSAIDYEALPPSFAPEVALWATLFDRGDSIGYARRLRRRPVHVFMPMARHDETMPNVTTEGMARAIGATLLGGEPGFVDLTTGMAPLRENVAVGEGMFTRGAWVYEVANHGLLLYGQDTRRYEAPVTPPFRERASPMPIENPLEDAQAQVVGFFETWRGGAAEISRPE
ncbi:MAG TPA: hypothetical protein RMG45_27120, partial [Polyangiaceae bacterium LLY-WYZ-15_(1-7)]|nr:hypothetical protein [Polyangiaceae bacterium LLY-WYZ-15_(1-7)]